MITSPHTTVCFGLRHGPQFVPQAVADVPLLPSLPVEAMKYVCSAANVVVAAGVGVGVETGVAVGRGVGVACGDGVGVGEGEAVGAPLGEAVGVVVACAVAVGTGVGDGPDLEGVLVPPPHAASSSAHATEAILNVVAFMSGRTLIRRVAGYRDASPAGVEKVTVRTRPACLTHAGEPFVR